MTTKLVARLAARLDATTIELQRNVAQHNLVTFDQGAHRFATLERHCLTFSIYDAHDIFVYRQARIDVAHRKDWATRITIVAEIEISTCLLYTSPSPRDRTRSRMPSSA